MIFTIPNSLGTTPLREENDCHLPGGSSKGGQFGSKQDCGRAILAPERLMPVGEQPSKPPDARMITEDQAYDSNHELLGDISYGEEVRASEKARIAVALGDRIKDHPGLADFYAEYHSQFKNYGAAGDDDAGFGAPNPEDVKDEYDTEYEEAYDKAREEAESQAIDDVQRQYTNKQDALAGERMELYEAALAAWAAQEPNSAGDISMVGSLPFEEGPLGPTEIRKFSPEEIVNQWEQDGDRAEFLSYYMPPERRDDAAEMEEYRRAQKSGDWAKSSSLVPTDILADMLKGTPYEKTFADMEWDEKKVVAKEFDYDLESIEVDDSDIGIGSFESWYEGKYGIDPDNWSEGLLGADPDASKAAAFLISSWASTSGDAAKLPVALQLAVAQEFGLHTSYTGEFFRRVQQEGMERDPFVQEVTSIMDKHGPFLQHFARAMYENTQEDLKARGISELVVFRGVKGRTGSGLAGLEPLESPDGYGIFADLNLQPASSFSTSWETAKGFGRMVMLARVPASRVIGTCRSGWGCLVEQEVVVLGGKLPGAYVANADDLDGPRYYWEDYQRQFRRLTAGGSS